jgi:hypothetical protein
MRMFCQDALAVGVEVVGDGSDALLLEVVGGGEGEGEVVEGVTRIVSHTEPSARAYRPEAMNAGGQNA